MSKDDFVDKYRHELAGLVVDAATSKRTGADLAMSLRFLMDKIDGKLGSMYADLVPDLIRKAARTP